MTLGGLGGVTVLRPCVVCGQAIEGHGHNAVPLAEGRCCDACNLLVIEHRLDLIELERAARAPGEAPGGQAASDE